MRYRRKGHRSGYRSGYGKDSIGRERARQHIEDARRLTQDLGGADADVKAYFFKLTPARLKPILAEYGEQYGESARAYAEKTMADWAAGRRHMSGTVAERLFNLLPPRMPLTDKYKLTQHLWVHYGPSSKKVLRVGAGVSARDVSDAFIDHVNGVLDDFRIPAQIEARFSWLSAGDVAVKQQLLNHMLQAEKALVAEGIERNMPVLTGHLGNDTDGLTTRVAHIVKVGKHELEILIDPEHDGLNFEDPAPSSVYYRSSSTSNFGCIVWMLVIGAVLLLLMNR